MDTKAQSLHPHMFFHVRLSTASARFRTYALPYCLKHLCTQSACNCALLLSFPCDNL